MTNLMFFDYQGVTDINAYKHRNIYIVFRTYSLGTLISFQVMD